MVWVGLTAPSLVSWFDFDIPRFAKGFLLDERGSRGNGQWPVILKWFFHARQGQEQANVA